MEDGDKLSGAPLRLQVVDGIVKVSLPLLVKVYQSRRSCRVNRVQERRPGMMKMFPGQRKQRLTVESNVTFLLQGPQQLAAIVRVSADLEDVFQPPGVEQHGVVQVGGVRADLQQEEVKVSRGRLAVGLGGGSPQWGR